MQPATSMGNMHLETLTKETIRQVVEEEKRRVEAVAAALREVIPSYLHPVLFTVYTWCEVHGTLQRSAISSG